MKLVNRMLFLIGASLLYACGGSGTESATQDAPAPTQNTTSSTRDLGVVEHVEISDPMDQDMIKGGKLVYDIKCSACHKLTDQRVVGPGWAGVTNRRTPEWIMNMITDTDMMLDSDPDAQALLEQCLVRMPNQHLSVGDARNVLEFMRKNDVDQTGNKDQAPG